MTYFYGIGNSRTQDNVALVSTLAAAYGTALTIGTDFNYGWYGRGSESLAQHFIDLVGSGNAVFTDPFPTGTGTSTTPSRSHWWATGGTGALQTEPITDLVLQPFGESIGFFGNLRRGDRWAIDRFIESMPASVERVWILATFPFNSFTGGTDAENDAAYVTQWAKDYEPWTVGVRTGSDANYPDDRTEGTADFYRELVALVRADNPGVKVGIIDCGGVLNDLCDGQFGTGDLASVHIDDMYRDTLHASIDNGRLVTTATMLYTILGSAADPTTLNAATLAGGVNVTLTATEITAIMVRVKARVDAAKGGTPDYDAVSVTAPTTDTQKWSVASGSAYTSNLKAAMRVTQAQRFHNLASTASLTTPGSESAGASAVPAIEGDFGEGALGEANDIPYIHTAGRGVSWCELDSQIADTSGLTISALVWIESGIGTSMLPVVGNTSQYPTDHGLFSSPQVQLGFKPNDAEARFRRSSGPTNAAGQTDPTGSWHRFTGTVVGRDTGQQTLRFFSTPLSENPLTTSTYFYAARTQTLSTVELLDLCWGADLTGRLAELAVWDAAQVGESAAEAEAIALFRSLQAEVHGTSATERGTLFAEIVANNDSPVGLSFPTSFGLSFPIHFSV